MKKSISLFLIFALCFALIPNEASAAVKISKTKTTIEVGSTLTLKIIGTKKTIKWTSSKKKIATVSDKGKITAVSSGVTSITATVDKKKYTCKVTVFKEDYSDWVLYETDNIELLAQNIVDGNVIYDGEQYWCSPEYFDMISNEEIIYYNDISDKGSSSILTPDTEISLIEDDKISKAEDEKALKERINELLKKR